MPDQVELEFKFMRAGTMIYIYLKLPESLRFPRLPPGLVIYKADSQDSEYSHSHS